MKPWTLSNLNGRKPLPASGPLWASAASMNETGLGRPNAAPAHAAVNRALRRGGFYIAFFLLFLRKRTWRLPGESPRVVSGGRELLFWGFLDSRPPSPSAARNVQNRTNA